MFTKDIMFVHKICDFQVFLQLYFGCSESSSPLFRRPGGENFFWHGLPFFIFHYNIEI